MKININDKAQVRLIAIMSIIVLLSTVVFAAVALNESNQTNETEKSNDSLEITQADLEQVIELSPESAEIENTNEEIIEIPEGEQTINSGNAEYADLSEAWWVTCADNTQIVWDENRGMNLPYDGDSAVEINGAYAPDLHTYEAFPECTTDNVEDYVDAECLLERCSELIEYNIITGEIRTIWRNGEFW